MSLVDYASSSEDDAEVEEKEEEEEEEKELEGRNEDPPPSVVNSQNQRLVSSSHEQAYGASHASAPSIEKLPDASVLLSSPDLSSYQMSSSDHYSRVAAAMAESASRKRESNGSTSYPRSKFPRGNLPHSRNVPDTVGGLLVPPQLNGRSNVVTEDINKLFVKRNADPPSH